MSDKLLLSLSSSPPFRFTRQNHIILSIKGIEGNRSIDTYSVRGIERSIDCVHENLYCSGVVDRSIGTWNDWLVWSLTMIMIGESVHMRTLFEKGKR